MRFCSTSYLLKALSVSVLVTLLTSILPTTQIADALTTIKLNESLGTSNPGGGFEDIRSVSPIETEYGLVAILVDEETWGSTASGRSFAFLGNTSIDEKIKTYANDVQSALPWTKTTIITVAEDDTPVEIQRLLEKFYFEGSDQFDEPTQLTGVVIVGDVPLPVVDKGGHRFISMLPYTDFAEPAYLLDENTQDFIENGSAQTKQPEAWHGLIVPPVDGQEGIDLLAAYFTKNHAFHSGDEDYTTFNQKVFMGDLVTEEDTINAVSFQQYERYTSLWEEISYSIYTSDILEELYTDMMDDVQEGDLLDNDGDGLYDEEANNGVDDDGDGLIDEDLGDGFFGIDNDGDCLALPAAQQDSNGDGIPCNSGDNFVDEDNADDNNNDADRTIELEDLDVEDRSFFVDQEVDEDPPGDANGDGCPGICGVDDNGWANDSDGDGYPDGWEIIFGYPIDDERKPYRSVRKKVNSVYSRSFTEDEDATAFLTAMFTDDMYGAYYQDDSCKDSSGVFHPEWDDDEDGLCDEDGSDELMDNGCAYNDADCDGEIDEDPIGLQPYNPFEVIPDLQTKDLIERMYSRYAEIFDQPQGLWNSLLQQTGRYMTRGLDEDDRLVNQYDTPVSLISKKDSITMEYLWQVNEALETYVDGVVEDLAQDIPLIAMMQAEGEYVIGGGSPTEFCDPTAGEGASDACLQFVNHSTDSPRLSFDQYLNWTGLRDENFYMYGTAIDDIEDVAQCSLFAGTIEDDGQMVQFNQLYAPSLDESVEEDRAYSKDVNNCVPSAYPYLDDIPEICDTPTVTEPIRALNGGIDATSLEDYYEGIGWETGYSACFEFRELNTYQLYEDSENDFADWFANQLRKFRKSGGSDVSDTSDDNYAVFLEKVEDKIASLGVGTMTLRAGYATLDVLDADTSRRYTVVDLLEDAGIFNRPDNDEIDDYVAMLDDNYEITVENPSKGTGMRNVDEIIVRFNKIYMHSDGTQLTDDPDDAKLLSSIYKHIEPKQETLNAQMEDIGSKDLPVDATRRVSFMDAAAERQEWNYVNTFRAGSMDDLETMIDELVTAVGITEGGDSYTKDIADLLAEAGINEEELEDALGWYGMNIDEKHNYIFSHYTGTENPVWAKAWDGYEIASIVVDGVADEMYFGFNAAPENEGDLEWIYRSEEAIAEALAADAEEVDEQEPLSELSNTTPVLLSEWIDAMLEWLEDTKNSVSSLRTYDGETNACGSAADFGGNADASGSGIPDNADPTASIRLSSDDNSVLKLGGGDFYIVSVSARQSDGSMSSTDSYTEVELEITSGSDSIEIVGNSALQLTEGVATFMLESTDVPGNFVLRANALNRDDLAYSNTLGGTVESKYVSVSTYVTETELGEGEVVAGDSIDIFDTDGEVVAVFNPDTGGLELRGAEAELREASSDLPTRVAIVDAEQTLASIFIIPNEKDVSVGDGIYGVFIEELTLNSEATESDDEDMFILNLSGQQIGAVTALGQIALEDGYYLAFDNPGEINLYDPLHVVDEDGNSLFGVTVSHAYSNGNIVQPDEPYDSYLSFLMNHAKSLLTGLAERFFLPGRALAAEIMDSDGDNLDDLEEWTIGTDRNNFDTDADGYRDGAEVYTGYDPLAGNGKPLFTDLGADHEAFQSIATLYVRGVISGYFDGSFLPDRNMTREEFVKVNLGSICLACTSYSDEYRGQIYEQYYQDPFPDGSSVNTELLPCVADAKVRGIISGYAGGEYDGYFLPQQYINRAEATKVLTVTAGLITEAEAMAKGSENWYDPYVDVATIYELFPESATVTDEWLGGYITRAEFAMMAVNLIEAQDCRNVDSDGDGLSDTEEESIYGTDPGMIDTDEGGVNDFDEVVRGSDPLDYEDDFDQEYEDDEPIIEFVETDFSDLLNYDHDSGIYVVSGSADFEEVSIISAEGESTVNVFTGEIPADGDSILHVRAEVRDETGQIYSQDNSSVIEFTLSSRQYGELMSRRVQVNSGQAETSFLTSEVAGELDVSAAISDGSLPSDKTDVWVYPGEPTNVILSGQSSVLPSGGEAVTEMRATLYDIFGNIANYGFYTITLDKEGGIELLDLVDEDADTDGIQVTTSDGYVDFRVLASPNSETANVLASIPELGGSGDSFALQHIDEMQLSVVGDRAFMLAGGAGSQTLNVTTVDRIGRLVTGFQGEVTLSLSDPAYGDFSTETLTLSEGQAQVTMTPGTLAGVASVVAESPGLLSGSASVTIKPDETYEFRIRKEDGTNVVKAGDTETFIVEAYDIHGNLATTDSSTTGSLRKTDATDEFGDLSKRRFQLNQGQAEFEVTAGNISGVLNLVASGTDLLAGTWSGDIDYSISGEEFADMEMSSLYTSLLGGPFGDVTQENYIGGWMTFNGKAQAVTSLISEPIPKRRLALIDADGAISFPNDALVSQTVSGAGADLPTRIQWRTFPDDTLMADVFYVMPETGNAASVKLVSNRPDLELGYNEEGDVVLREDSAAVVKVRQNGQAILMNSDYSLAVNGDSEGLSFLIYRMTDQVATLTFNTPWTSGVTLLDSDFDLKDWATLSTGIYIRPTSAFASNIVSIPTGNSSANPMGLAIVDPDEDLPDSMQPSLGYASLEAAEEDGSVGWRNESKHLLLFSAGNTVGQSNLYYPSEVGVVLGDPTVSLTTENDVNEAGFTTDIGKMISASQDDVLELIDLDYNVDGKEDVLIAYESGRIDVMQNVNSDVRLRNEGTLLFVESGIKSIDRGDFNGDEMEDLLIVTEDSCYAGEMCLYAYENIGGGFVARNLEIEGIGNPEQIEVGDLNGDGYDEIVLADENLMLYVVWNAEGSFNTIDDIKNFALEADDSQNLYADLLIRYDDLADGSASLDMETEISEEQEVYIDTLVGIDDFTLTGTQDVTVTESFAFEYADNLDDYFTVTKTLTDNNGGDVELGDSLTYTIYVRNKSGQDFADFYISDTLGGLFDYTEDSFAVSGSGSGRTSFSSTGAELLDGDSSHPWIYGPVTLPNSRSFQVSYDVTVQALPDLKIMLGHDINSDYKDDDFMDIAVSMDGNTTGELMIYYSDGYITESGRLGGTFLDGVSFKRVSYVEKKYSPDDEEYEEDYDNSVESPFEDADEDGVPDFIGDIAEEGAIEVPTGYDPFAELFGAEDTNGNDLYEAEEMFQSDTDADNDGLNDTIDAFINTASLLLDPDMSLDTEEGFDFEASAELADNAVQAIEEVVSKLTCNGGCLALPGSIAFMAPGKFHDPFTGTALGNDPLAMPVFGVMPMTPFVCTLKACDPTSIFRLYVAPTTTLGLGTGLCFGQKPLSLCFAFSIPLMQMLGVCDAINNLISDSLSKASDYISNGDNAAFNVDGTQSSSGDSVGLASNVFESYVPPVDLQKNIQIPGFPDVFTEWWKAQKYEFQKMLDLPDITFVGPDLRSLTSTTPNLDLGQDDEMDPMEGGIFGMENILNSIHSLPIIDIEPESVYFHYPWITEEEIEQVEYDWEQWIVAFNAEADRFEDELIEYGFADVREEFQSLRIEIVGSMEANLAALASYREAPRTLLELRTMQAEYAKQIICYLDLILDYSAGYFLENAQRIEAWAKWIDELREIIGGWSMLIDLSVDMMDDCDKCTNQRMSMWQTLMSLFIFIPDLPVLEMPKLPDIVLDVSEIQAGVDVVWPDIQFIAEPVNLPQVPRVSLPSVSAEAEFDFDIDVDIPVLPEFPEIPEFPELPGVSVPDLPTLPPPPAIPAINPEIEAALDITSSILKIICIFRQGFMPVKEGSLKTKIEEITERGSDFVLPFDLATETQWPSLSFDFVEKVEINTYLNLTPDFSLIYDLVDALAEESNTLTSDIADELTDAMYSLSNELQAAASAPGEIDIEIEEDVDVDLEAFSSGTDWDFASEMLSTAQTYKNEPLVSDNIAALKSVLESLNEEFAAWDEQMPDSYKLVAGTQDLLVDEEMLEQYDQVISEGDSLEKDFIASIQNTPLADIASLKESLIAYVDDLETSTMRLEHMDSEKFLAYVAAENLQPNVLMASSNGDELGSFSTRESMGRLLADVSMSDSGSVDSYADLDFTLVEAKTYNDGLYIYDEDAGMLRLTEYKQESDGNVNILFVDVDSDGDEDIVYSLGGDVYLKENHTEDARERYSSSDPVVASLAEVAPAHGAIQNFKRANNEHQQASMSFSAGAEAVGYEMLFYDSLDAAVAEPEENIKRILMLEDSENENFDFYDEEGESFGAGSTLPTLSADMLYQNAEDADDAYSYLQVESGSSFASPIMRDSRVVVDDVSGSVLLQNGYKRTEMTENSALETSDGVIMQTIEDSMFEVTIGSKSMYVWAPAYTWIDFGRNESREIRLDAGRAIWIETAEIVEEQDAIAGMEIFKDEVLYLDGFFAAATLATTEGAAIELDNEEVFAMDQLTTPSSPSVSLSLENGAYYVVNRGLFADGQYGTLANKVMLNPQVCADDNSPFAILDSGDEVDLAIFSTMELSAESSFDTDSEIVDAYWDLDASVDVNGDGIANNDEEIIGLTAEIGPYEDVDQKEVTVWIVDAAGNESTATVTVNIYVPEVIIDEASTSEVSGTTSPESPEFPFHLIRERDGALTDLGDGNAYLTDEDGGWVVDDLNNSDLISVFNTDNEVIAMFNPETKQLLVYDNAYDSAVLPASWEWPARLIVYEKINGTVMASFVFVSDEETNISSMYLPLEEYDLGAYDNVAVYIPDEYQEEIEISDSLVFARDQFGSLEFAISNTGNITIYDESFNLKKREASSLNEELIIELYAGDDLIMELWPGAGSEVTIMDAEDLDLPASLSVLRDVIAGDYRLYFEDISKEDPLYDDIAELVERGILEGYQQADGRYFLPDNQINRAEFTKIILGILCIVPGDDAYRTPNVFNDILDTSNWYYPYTKEAYSRGLITGYEGEIDSAGMTPFKPNNTITRAEAAKIVLEALDKEGIIELPENLDGDPWYEPYISIAMDLTPYLTSESTAGEENFILTTKEAMDPSHVVTRYEFVEMSARVLQAYNCFDLDSDGDGLINYDEEAIYGTDPYNPDTDYGGVDDGTEVGRGSDPLDGTDDFEGGKIDVDPGIYAISETCIACPCYSSLGYNADLRAGDSVFAIIQNELGEIFGKSNTVTIE